MIPAWIKLISAPLRARIAHRPNLQNALANTGWLFGDKILRMGVGLLVGVWVARYLGPEQFGLMNYAMAIVALFGAVASLGLNGIVVRDLVNEPGTANETLGTAFILQAIGGLLALGLAVLAIGFARPDDNLARSMVAVLGFVMVFKSTDVVKYWFDSQVKSRYVVWVENSLFLVLAGVKVGLILMGASLMAFVWAAFAEAVLAAAGLLGVYAWRGGALGAWRIRYERAKSLLKDSWPLILSGLAIMVYMRIDQIMLGQMLGDEAVGIYSAAVRISEVWYFVPVAIISSAMPAIIAARKTDPGKYLEQFQKLYELMALLALSVAIPMSVLSDYAVGILFGGSYAGAGGVLAIHTWAAVFVFLGLASSQWLIQEGRQHVILQRTLLGALLNVLANLWLIPAHGAVGAAWATTFSYAIAVFSVGLRVDTRQVFVMMGRSFLFKNLIRSIHA